MNQITDQPLLSFDAASPFLLTKSAVQSFADSFIEKVNEGFINPLETAAILSGLEAAIKVIKDGIRPTVLAELKEAGKGSYNGVKIETMEAGGRYDFSQCSDLVYEGLRLQSEGIDIQLKAREVFLKAVPKAGIIVTDENTGETVTIYPPAKPASTTTYKVSIPK